MIVLRHCVLSPFPSFFHNHHRNAVPFGSLDYEITTFFIQRYILTGNLTIDMETDVPAVAIPVYMIMGERDFWLVQARRYFDRLEAPEKKMFVIHDAGHIVRGDKPEEVEKILFSVIGSTAR